MKRGAARELIDHDNGTVRVLFSQSGWPPLPQPQPVQNEDKIAISPHQAAGALR